MSSEGQLSVQRRLHNSDVSVGKGKWVKGMYLGRLGHRWKHHSHAPESLALLGLCGM